MQVNDSIYDGEPQAATGFAKTVTISSDPVESFKDSQLLIIWNSRTGIFDG